MKDNGVGESMAMLAVKYAVLLEKYEASEKRGNALLKVVLAIKSGDLTPEQIEIKGATL